jgi:hypothetical protein
MTPPKVVDLVDYLYPAALLLAVALPCFRATVRLVRRVRPCFTARNFFHDAAGGLSLPYFVMLILSPLSPGVLAHIDSHAYVLAGLMGIIYTFADLMEAAPHD